MRYEVVIISEHGTEVLRRHHVKADAILTAIGWRQDQKARGRDPYAADASFRCEIRDTEEKL